MFKLSKNKNLLFYGTSLIGSSHVKLGSVCQDANKVIRLSNGWIVAAVADGVGSAKHSDIASKMAVDTVAEICNIRIDKQSKLSELRNVILEAYREAERRIEDYADKKGDSITEYDTTLSMVVYDGENICVAIIDTGISPHLDFSLGKNRIKKWQKYKMFAVLMMYTAKPKEK